MKNPTGQRRGTVCLLGADFDTNNRGVSALSSSLLRLMRRFMPDARILYFKGGLDFGRRSLRMPGGIEEVEVVNYRLSPRGRLKEHILWLVCMAFLHRLAPVSFIKRVILKANPRIQMLESCDFIGDIHGGDSFSDIYGLARFAAGLLPIAVVALLGKKLVMFPQTYGPFRTKTALLMARWTLRRTTQIMSRDFDSMPLVREVLGKSASRVPLAFCPDVAFTLPSRKPCSIAFKPIGTARRPVLGLNVNGLMFNGGYTGRNDFGLLLEYKEFIRALVQRFLRDTETGIMFLPHTYGRGHSVNNDWEACRRISDGFRAPYGERLHLVTEQYSEFELKGLIGQCDFFIGSRMHACIAAVSQHVPTAAVAYSKKFAGVFESIGLGDIVIDARVNTQSEALDRVFQLYNERAGLRLEIMGKKVESAKSLVDSTFGDLLRRLAR